MRGFFARKKSGIIKLIVIVLIAFGLMCVLHLQRHQSNTQSNLNFFLNNVKLLNNVKAIKCTLPKYDIYDPEISSYINKPPVDIECGKPQPYLTYMDWNGTIHLNATEVQLNEYKDLKCSYEVVKLDTSNDYKVLYEDLKQIDAFPISIRDFVVRVKCENDNNHVYSMIHSQIRPLPKFLLRMNNAIPKHRPSVLIFTIDSMSRGNFLRCLPKTYNYLHNKQSMDVFEGLNKVADNTFPNMMALLAGYIAYPREGMSHVPTWSINKNSTAKRYDDMPIIWKDFIKSGYMTMYAEEYLDATFSYLDVGFEFTPVHYYYRSTYVSLKDTLANLEYNRFKFWNKSKWRYCLGNQPSYKYMLNYTEEFLVEMANYKYFALSFFVEMSHEYLNDVKNMDDDLLAFFQRMFDGGMFDNTIVLVMGDHGHRFDDIRSTFIGRIEERMPFLGIILPKTLRNSHPHLKTALESHTERLLSWYDIHETLVDIALDDLEVIAKYPRPKSVGKSIFRLFDENRSCQQIGILPEYCMCDKEAQIPNNSSKATETADLIVKQVNKLLEDAPKYSKNNDNKTCAFLSLSLILSTSVSMKTYSYGSPSLLVRVILKVSPSDALLEAAVEYSPNSEPQVLGDINRINKYGNQSSCITHDIMRMYCYCW